MGEDSPDDGELFDIDIVPVRRVDLLREVTVRKLDAISDTVLARPLG